MTDQTAIPNRQSAITPSPDSRDRIGAALADAVGSIEQWLQEGDYHPPQVPFRRESCDHILQAQYSAMINLIAISRLAARLQTDARLKGLCKFPHFARYGELITDNLRASRPWHAGLPLEGAADGAEQQRIALLETRIADLQEDLKASRDDLAQAMTETRDAEARAQILLDAKNHWAERARAAVKGADGAA